MLLEHNASPCLYVAREEWMRYGNLQQHADIRGWKCECLGAWIIG